MIKNTRAIMGSDREECNVGNPKQMNMRLPEDGRERNTKTSDLDV